MRKSTVVRWLPWLGLIPLFTVLAISCVEIKIVGASVTDGPSADGSLTLRLDVSVAIEQQEPAEGGEEMEMPTSQSNQLCYVAAVLPDELGVGGGRMVGEAAMGGEGGARAMGHSPQVARVFDREFPAPEGHRWIALHTVLDTVDVTRNHAMAVELELTGVPEGTTDMLVALGYLDDAGTQPSTSRPTELQLVVGKDKALVRVVPDEPPAGEEAS